MIYRFGMVVAAFAFACSASFAVAADFTMKFGSYSLNREDLDAAFGWLVKVGIVMSAGILLINIAKFRKLMSLCHSPVNWFFFHLRRLPGFPPDINFLFYLRFCQPR